ncbi:MAG: hypothetical protein LBT59_20485 [Clostridiales bacterium]|nr:hypothetical protein [Clostridiales bacterium]
MAGYKNFVATIYAPVSDTIRVAESESFEEAYSWLEKRVSIGKIYLETYRHGVRATKEQVLKAKSFFESRGVTVSGGITTDLPPTKEGGFHQLCYCDLQTREFIQNVSEFTAELFDEIILDDFYFTNCKCPACVKAKGDRTWAEFRLELMNEVSKSVIVDPAKKVNPKVNYIIKYPNWYEHFQDLGYNLKDEPQIFDAVYTGTETRNPLYAQQHLQKYLSYFNMRLIESAAPGRNGGGWFDPFECTYNLTSYAQQAQLTLLAKPKEAMLFCLGALLQSDYSLCAPVAGQVFADMDKYLGELGNPIGAKTYLPFHSCGEDFVHNYIGMLGIPLEPVTKEYPEGAKVVFLAESAAHDAGIVEKVSQSLLDGADVIVTSGFVRKTYDRGFNKIVNVSVDGSKALVSRYMTSNNGGVSFNSLSEGSKPVLIPQMFFQTNDTWAIASGLGENNSFPVLLKCAYGTGRVFVLAVPDDFGDLYNYPRPVLNAIRELFTQELGITLDAPSQVALFAYDNDTFALHSFLPYLLSDVSFTLPGELELEDLVNRKTVKGESCKDGTAFKISLMPGVNKVLKKIRR